MGSAVDTIAAIATPLGFGGVGIVRVSGPRVVPISERVLGDLPKPRHATHRVFLDSEGEAIDQGIALYFAAPHSFTGEDVLEFQGHGGLVVLDLVLRRVLELGARPARPGEFTERAFLNGKIDLIQAEATADLIASTTETAARMAGRTLQGAFSERVHELVDSLIRLRAFVEAAIDFPEEDIDLLQDSQVSSDLCDVTTRLAATLAAAEQGSLMREGIRIVIAGPPNAGKSSLLNALAGSDRAIVTEVPGTTRDPLHEEIQIDGMPVHIIDTAGLRASEDPVEQEGIRRARAKIDQADRILWVVDDRETFERSALDAEALPASVPVTLVRNKIDLTGRRPGVDETALGTEVALSALSGLGLEELRDHLRKVAGYTANPEGLFMARRRHLDALQLARTHLRNAADQQGKNAAPELLAEHLRLAQHALSEITGEFTSDDLLGEIFSSFCIGK